VFAIYVVEIQSIVGYFVEIVELNTESV